MSILFFFYYKILLKRGEESMIVEKIEISYEDFLKILDTKSKEIKIKNNFREITKKERKYYPWRNEEGENKIEQE